MSAGEPNYSGYDNATLYQVFQSGMVIQTDCFINIQNTPPLASDLKPINAQGFQGPETDRYILYNNVQYRNYTTEHPIDEISE